MYDDRVFIGRDEKYVEVPFLIYAKKSYSDANGGLMERLGSCMDLPLSIANVIYTLMTLSSTEYEPDYKAKKIF